MAPSFRSNDWWPVYAGPSSGRLQLEVFGEPDRPQEVEEVLTFTIRNTRTDQPDWEHVIGIWFEGIAVSEDFIRGEASGPKEYTITGYLASFDGNPIKTGLARDLLPVTIRYYMPSKRDKGLASLKVTDSAGFNLELLIA